MIIAGCFLLMVCYVFYLHMDSAPVSEDIFPFKGRTLLADGGSLASGPHKSRIGNLYRYRFEKRVFSPDTLNPAGPFEGLLVRQDLEHQLNTQVPSSGILYPNHHTSTIIRDTLSKKYRFHPTVRPTQGISVQSVINQVLGHHQLGKDLSESHYASSPTSISAKGNYLYHRNAGVCPIRNIIKRLHEPNTSALTVNTAIKDLSHCKTIYFTSVQKCSTQTMYKLFQSLQSTNHFQTVSWLHQIYPLPWSTDFFRNVTNRPLLSLHRREARYENFTKFGFPLPVYLSMVRHPVDRLVSLYYFRIFGSGDNSSEQLSMLAKWKHCRNTSIDDIVDSIQERNMVNVRMLLHSDTQIHECWPSLTLQQNYFCDVN